ncbi:Hypothetical protein BQ3484_70, partial [Cedratvirus A11]
VGTYELWTAVQRAIEREDVAALEGYLPLLSEEVHGILRAELSGGKYSKHAAHKKAMQFLQSYYSLESDEEEELDVLSRVRRGEGEALEKALRDLSKDKLSRFEKDRLLLYSIESGREDPFIRVLSALSGRHISLPLESFSPNIVTIENVQEIYPLEAILKFRPPLDVSKRELMDAALYSKIHMCIAHMYLTTVGMYLL